MKQKILFDTSVWIEYFKNSKAETSALIDKYLLMDCVYINGIIIAELVQGLKSKKEKSLISKLFLALHILEIDINQWRFAGEISQGLREKGVTLPLTDIAIAANAIKNKAELITFDKHFVEIENLNLKLLMKG